MGYKIISEPSVEPLLLADVKTRLSISDTVDDDDITSHIKSARLQAENYMRRSIITQTIELALDAFPSSEIELIRGPVQSITSVKYLDTDGVEQTVSIANYSLDDYSFQHWLLPAYGYDWPSTYDAANAVKVRYVAGFGDAGSDVPEDILTAMLLAIGHWIRFQAVAESGIGPTRMPRQFYDLLDRHRIYKF